MSLMDFLIRGFAVIGVFFVLLTIVETVRLLLMEKGDDLPGD